MSAPERAYLVCATQRSGSTLLCRLLGETGVAGNPQEYFEAVAATGRPPHPGDFLGGIPHTGLGIRDDVRPPKAPAYSSLEGLPDYRAHLERTLADATSANGVFGAKIMFNQIVEVEKLARTLPEYRGLRGAPLLQAITGCPEPVRWIWARRRDTVRQAVSMWKAIQTRSWRGDEARDDRAPEYRYDAIDHLRARFEADEAGWRRFFEEWGITPFVVGYEDDLEARRDDTVNAVLRFIGIDPPPTPDRGEPLTRQADELSAQWVAAYHRDRAWHGEMTAVPGGAP
jgi:trehalose 2-sulfotransferase